MVVVASARGRAWRGEARDQIVTMAQKAPQVSVKPAPKQSSVQNVPEKSGARDTRPANTHQVATIDSQNAECRTGLGSMVMFSLLVCGSPTAGATRVDEVV